MLNGCNLGTVRTAKSRTVRANEVQRSLACLCLSRNLHLIRQYNEWLTKTSRRNHFQFLVFTGGLCCSFGMNVIVILWRPAAITGATCDYTWELLVIENPLVARVWEVWVAVNFKPWSEPWTPFVASFKQMFLGKIHTVSATGSCPMLFILYLSFEQEKYILRHTISFTGGWSYHSAEHM